MRSPALAAVVLLLAAGCSSSSSKPDTVPSETNPCTGTTLTPGCVATPGAPTQYPYPPDASQVSPLPTVDPIDGELARISNDSDPTKRTGELTVVIPKGRVISTNLTCQGRGTVAVTTVPPSQGEQTINCDGNPSASQLGVFASDVETTDHTYEVLLKASGPSRWLLVVAQIAPMTPTS